MFYRVGVHRAKLARTANTLVGKTGSHVKSYDCDVAHVNLSAQVVARQKFVRKSSNRGRRNSILGASITRTAQSNKKNRAARGLSVVVGGRTAIVYLLQGTALNNWRLAAAASIRVIPMGAVHQLAAAAWAETPSVFSLDVITRRVIAGDFRGQRATET